MAPACQLHPLCDISSAWLMGKNLFSTDLTLTASKDQSVDFVVVLAKLLRHVVVVYICRYLTKSCFMPTTLHFTEAALIVFLGMAQSAHMRTPK